VAPVVGSGPASRSVRGIFSSRLQAQASKAKIVGLANGGSDIINAIKQARSLDRGHGQNLAGIVIVHFSDINSLGLKLAQGLIIHRGYLLGSERPHAAAFAPALLRAHEADADHLNQAFDLSATCII